MRKKFVYILMIVLVVALFASCGGSYAASKKLSEQGVNRVKAGKTMTISQDENQSIPYRWHYVISDESLVSFTKEEIKFGFSLLPKKSGAGGEKHRFYFEATGAGECTIELRYEHIGDDQLAVSETYTILISE